MSIPSQADLITIYVFAQFKDDDLINPRRSESPELRPKEILVATMCNQPRSELDWIDRGPEPKRP